MIIICGVFEMRGGTAAGIFERDSVLRGLRRGIVCRLGRRPIRHIPSPVSQLQAIPLDGHRLNYGKTPLLVQPQYSLLEESYERDPPA